MNADVLRVQLRTVIPTNNGSAVFLTDGEKTIVISVDGSVGLSITMLLQGVPRERPMTHDLIQHILAALGAKVERIVINDMKGGTYYARLILSAKNELQEKEKIMEIDARPSDCMAIAIAHDAPIYIANEVWEEAEDMSEALQQMEESAQDDLSEDDDEEEDDE